MTQLNSSPGVYLGEFNINAYSQNQAAARVCVMGGATKGPVGVPTWCYGAGDLMSKFGPPVLNDNGLETAMQVLTAASAILYLRVADSAVAATQDIPGITGGTPAAQATGTITFTGTVNPSNHDTITIGDGTNSVTFKFNNDNILGGDVGVTLGSTAALTMTNLITAINNSILQIVAVNSTISVPETTLTNDVGGTAGNVAMTKTGTAPGTLVGMSGGAAAIAGSSETLSVISALTPGSWGNNIYVTITCPSVIPGASDSAFDIAVFAPVNPNDSAVLVENFTNMSFTSGTTNFLDTVLAQGIAGQINPSQYISSDTSYAGAPTGAPTTYTLGTGGGAVGADGISSLAYTDYVGTVTGRTATGLAALSNPDTSNFNTLIIAGISDNRVIQPAIALAESRGDFLYIIDPPFGLTVAQIIEWHNGLQPEGVPNSPTEAINTSFACLPWAWLQNYDPYNQVDVWIPPSAFLSQLIVQVDLLSGPWQPAAGWTYGTVQALDVEWSPDQADRDQLNGVNNVNPFTAMPGGYVMMGNKTLYRTPNVYAGLHVRRLLIYAKVLVRAVAQTLLMSPINATTMQRFTQLCNGPLNSIASQQGLQQFLVVCNQSNNPVTSRVTRTLNGYVILQPNDVAERIVVQFAATSDAAVFTNTTVSPVGS